MRGIRVGTGLERRSLPYIPGQPAMHDISTTLVEHVRGTRSPETGERR